jgi:hypothetical protein
MFALIPLSPENQKGVTDSNQPDLNYDKDILDDDSQDSFMGKDYSKHQPTVTYRAPSYLIIYHISIHITDK